MKKILALTCLLALMLTGCGESSQSTAESSAPAAESSSEAPKDTPAEESSEEESSEEEAPAEASVFDWEGFDMPIQAGMEKLERERDKDIWAGGTEENPVYFALCTRYNYDVMDSIKNGENKYTLQDVPEQVARQIREAIDCFSSCYDEAAKTIEKSGETTFMEFPVLFEEGTLTTDASEPVTYHYIAYYSYLTYPVSGSANVPSAWIAFTPSDDKDALDLMRKAAEAPLTEATVHQYGS